MVDALRRKVGMGIGCGNEVWTPIFGWLLFHVEQSWGFNLVPWIFLGILRPTRGLGCGMALSPGLMRQLIRKAWLGSLGYNVAVIQINLRSYRDRHKHCHCCIRTRPGDCS
ncbi:hypothetical protein JB92DRAFT_1307365 [Gautieria morchelliformis]|nr:hypothetical protein JB92DRAFT_1307365 [Gautieria morchelliformis]